MFSIKANTMYSLDEKGQHSLEISYTDSDGVNVGAYSEGDKFEDVIFDVIDQLDEGIAEFNDDKADVAEIDDNEEYIRQLQQQIAELQAQIADLQARNNELEKRHAEKLNRKSTLDDDLKTFVDNFRKSNGIDTVAGKSKISDFPFTLKRWV